MVIAMPFVYGRLPPIQKWVRSISMESIKSRTPVAE